MAGYILLHRQIQDNPIWQDKPFSKGQAWIDLLLMANYADGQMLNGNQMIDVKRGQLFRSMGYLANRWGWSVKKTKLFLSFLENQKMVLAEGLAKGTLLTVENYEFYQDQGLAEGLAEGTAWGQLGASLGPQKKKNNKNNKKEKEINKEKEKANFDLSDLTPLLRDSVSAWIAYKEERNEGYKPRGFQAWLAQVKRHAQSYEDKHIAEVIERSMSCQYKGVVWDWLKEKPQKPKQNAPPQIREIASSEKLTEEERAENMRRMKEAIGGVFK